MADTSEKARKKALENWKRLVTAVSPASSAPLFFESVPSSLDYGDESKKDKSNIHNMLAVAGFIHEDNPKASEILHDCALKSSEDLDPKSTGRGVLQFKIGLISRLREGGRTVHPKRLNEADIKILQNCYLRYHKEYRSPRLDTKEEEDQKIRKKKVKMILRVLQDVLKDYKSSLCKEVKDAIQSDAELLGDPTPYNILPLKVAPLEKHAREILQFPEVKAALEALKSPGHSDDTDIFDQLKIAFGFQVDNLRNQREHLILLLANAHSRDYDKKGEGLFGESNPEGHQRLPEKAIKDVYIKILENYVSWCLYIREKRNCVLDREKRNCVLDRVQSDYEMVALMALYLCIWGEAANVRFLPECICYIFHKMAQELLPMLDIRKIDPSKSCMRKDGDVSFLEEIITPVYAQLQKEAAESKAGKAAHSKWCNYDDINEFFWSHSCFEQLKGWPSIKGPNTPLSDTWPEEASSSIVQQGKGGGRFFRKASFVEHRTFLHLYHSFVRVWILLVMMLQGLAILAFTGSLDLQTLKILLSLGPTYFMMKLIESVLDIVMMYGAYSGSRSDAIVRIFTQFLFYGGCTGGLSYLYWQLILEKSPSYFYLKLFLWVLGPYVALKLLISLCQHIPSVGEQAEKTGKVADAFLWLLKERFYVGRGLFEHPRDYVRYALFWVIVLACKFTFSYYFQIKPLADATKLIFSYGGVIEYAWHDFVSRNNHNALAMFFMWAPVVLVYLLDIQIWYTVFSAILGVMIGVKDHLGEIRSFDMLRNRFDSFPDVFIKNLQHDKPPSGRRTDVNEALNSQQRKEAALIYAPFWNKIIECLREEDYISNVEKELLVFPLNRKTKLHTEYVEWPLFLLASKVSVAIKMVKGKKEREDPKEIIGKLNRDEYMTSAIAEAFESVHILLNNLVPERKLFNTVYDDVKKLFNEDPEGQVKFLIDSIDSIENIHKKVQNLTMLLVMLLDKQAKESDPIDKYNEDVDKAVQSIYEAVLPFHQEYKKRFPSISLENSTSMENPEVGKHVNISKPEMKEWCQRMHLLLTTTESSSTVPMNGEARRRLEFFTNSLFMAMPHAPSVRAMKSFSAFTPYYNEFVVYSVDDLIKPNEDGITILFYLQKIFPDEWQNFLERIGMTEKALTSLLDKPTANDKVMEPRLWASYRGQTLARTVRGMMYYREALALQAFVEEQGTEEIKHARAQALSDFKFTYVVACQLYGQQKASSAKENIEKANDIRYLLRMNEGLRVAFIDIVDVPKGEKSYYSKLVKSGESGTDQEIYSIKLPGNPILGEGKPENQNHAIIFTRGDALQTIDMNQDNYFEEALKMRNLLEEFEADHGKRRRSEMFGAILGGATILGVREHIFTGSVSSLAWFMSNQETSFVTLGQRVLARPLKVRMHYGHPDVFDRLFHLTRGGISKASKTINVSEDIYAGFNSTLRQGNVTHHEYIQVGKGRDVGLNQIAQFEAKVSSGNGEQLLSRDVYRLGQLFDFFRMLSFYVTSVGYYACTMMTTLVIYFFLYGKVYLALSGVGEGLESYASISKNQALRTALDTQFMFQIGVFTAIPMLMVFILEQGAFKAVVNFITMQLQLCSVFFTFSLGTRTHYFGQTVLHGGAKYQATGRGFVVQHIKFADNYRLYSRSHFVKALEIVMLLLVIKAYGYDSSPLSYFLFSCFSWFLAISWLFAPYIFNPSGFEWQKTVEDFDDWMKWLLYRGGVGVTINDSWEAWWKQGQEHISSPLGRIWETILSLRFFIFQFGVVYHLKVANHSLSLTVYGISWLVLIGVVLIFLVFFFGPSSSVNYQMLVRLIQGMIFIILTAGLIGALVLRKVTFGDVCASVLALVPTGWGILSIAIAWRPVVKGLGLWKFVSCIAWGYDAAMAMIIFLPIAILSWFPFVSTFQTRLLFNQVFSRGLEISLILAGNKPSVETRAT